MSLLDVSLKKEYRSPRDNIVTDFYIPLLKEAKLYKRSVGFFSSSSLLEISYGISNLINNGVKPNIVKELVRHGDIATTLGIYTHVNNDDLSKTIEEIYGKEDK